MKYIMDKWKKMTFRQKRNAVVLTVFGMLVVVAVVVSLVK